MVWQTHEQALAMLRPDEGDPTNSVRRITMGEFNARLEVLRDGGVKFIIINKSLDGSGRIVPINEMIDLYQQSIAKFNAIRPGLDEFVRLLDGKRSVGLPVESQDLYLPIDCGKCGSFFSVYETEYRRWRSGEMAEMLCPHCLSLFKEGRWGRVACSTCGTLSRNMPLSASKHFAGTWLCDGCHGQIAEKEIQAALGGARNASTPKAGRSGCLLLICFALAAAIPTFFCLLSC